MIFKTLPSFFDLEKIRNKYFDFYQWLEKTLPFSIFLSIQDIPWEEKKIQTLLSPMETEITSRFQSESRKKEFSLGRILLKKLIEQMTGSDYHSLSILKDSKGKPYLYPETLEKIHISLSHKSSFLWAGVSQKPFGIDIEKKDPRILNLKSKVFSFKKTLAQNEDELTFFSRLWTLQEAAVKCLETDFMDIASNLSLENFENGESLLIYYNKVKDIKIFLKGNSIESENYFFSIMRRE